MKDETVADVLTDEGVIFRRTSAGQYEAVLESPHWNGPARRLLLAVNGHTPLGALLALFAEAREAIVQCVPLLTDAGLIEPV